LEDKLISASVLSAAISEKRDIVKKWQNPSKIIKKQAATESKYATTKGLKARQ
jgi:hypothetical protein